MKHFRTFTWLPALALIWLSVGCAEPLRFAPSEAQKQSAWLTKDIAQNIYENGTTAGSPAAAKVKSGTATTALWFGPPKYPADPDEFETVTDTAQHDAQQRPDAWTVADNALGLGISIALLFGGGGAGSVKLIQSLKNMRRKGRALEQIVKNNELFKKEVDDQTRVKFAKSQASQTTDTKLLVSEIKATSPG